MRFYLSIFSEDDCYFDGPERKTIEGENWKDALQKFIDSASFREFPPEEIAS